MLGVVSHNKMKFYFSILAFFIVPLLKSQNTPFDEAIKKIYFNVSPKNTNSKLLIDSFISVSDLKYIPPEGYTMLSPTVKRVVHNFTFTKSSLPEATLNKGKIEITVTEIDSEKEEISIVWRSYFNTKAEGLRYFNNLSRLFIPIATKEKISGASWSVAQARYSNKDSKLFKKITFVLYAPDKIDPQYQLLIFIK